MPMPRIILPKLDQTEISKWANSDQEEPNFKLALDSVTKNLTVSLPRLTFLEGDLEKSKQTADDDDEEVIFKKRSRSSSPASTSSKEENPTKKTKFFPNPEVSMCKRRVLLSKTDSNRSSVDSNVDLKVDSELKLMNGNLKVKLSRKKIGPSSRTRNANGRFN